MIPLQLMIGQLTGQPLPVPLPAPAKARQFAIRDEAYSRKTEGRTPKELAADANRTIQTMKRGIVNLRLHYGKRIFSETTVRKERPFPIGKDTLHTIVEHLLRDRVLRVESRGVNSTYYCYTDCDSPEPLPKNKQSEGYKARVNHICEFVRSWSKAQSSFSIPELRIAVDNLGTAADDAVMNLVDTGELVEMRDGRGRRKFKAKGASDGQIQSAA
jgi:hypothetical protein